MNVVCKAKGLDEPGTVRSAVLVTSVRITDVGGHERLEVWNRGGKAGDLYVGMHDGFKIARRLLGGDMEIEEEGHGS